METPSLEEVAARREAFLAAHPEAAGRITHITDAFLQHTGQTLEELTGYPIPVNARLAEAEDELDQTRQAILRKDREIADLNDELAKCYRLIAILRGELRALDV